MKHITEISNKELIAEIGNRMMNEYKNECKTNKQKYDTAKTHIICKIEIGEETINPLLYCKEFKQKTEYTEKYTVICSECVNALKAENAKLTEQLENSVVLPFKNGDTIYTVCLKKNGHTEDFIGEFHITDDCDFEIWARENTRGYLIHKSRKGIKYNKKCSNFGKYWFLTKSEAEARLAELEGKSNDTN